MGTWSDTEEQIIGYHQKPRDSCSKFGELTILRIRETLADTRIACSRATKFPIAVALIVDEIPCTCLSSLTNDPLINRELTCSLSLLISAFHVSVSSSLKKLHLLAVLFGFRAHPLPLTIIFTRPHPGEDCKSCLHINHSIAHKADARFERKHNSVCGGHSGWEFLGQDPSLRLGSLGAANDVSQTQGTEIATADASCESSRLLAGRPNLLGFSSKYRVSSLDRRRSPKTTTPPPTRTPLIAAKDCDASSLQPPCLHRGRLAF